MKKTASKVAESQILFHKNLPPRDFSIMTLVLAEKDFKNLPEIDSILAVDNRV